MLAYLGREYVWEDKRIGIVALSVLTVWQNWGRDLNLLAVT